MPPRLTSARHLVPLLLAIFLAIFMALTVAAPMGARAQAPPPAAKRISPPGYALRISRSISAPAGTRTRGIVRCPKGTVPLSGGADVNDQDVQVSLSDSFPAGSAWIVDISNAGNIDNSFVAVVTCARKVPQYRVISAPSSTLMPASSEGFFATCPAGSRPLGGGVRVAPVGASPVSLGVAMASTAPSGRQWLVQQTNAGATSASVRVMAICGSVPRYHVFAARPTDAPAASQTMVQVTCPAPTVVMGGGVFTNVLSLSVNLAWSTMDEGFDWFAAVNNTSDASVSATAVVVCGS